MKKRTNSQSSHRQEKRHVNYLPFVAAAVVIIAAAVTWLPGRMQGEETQQPEGASVTDTGDLLIAAQEIQKEASFFDYDADGTTVQVLAVLASDGTIRLALNTCQVCNGSPYAYFVQDGDWFICQNCRNRFASAEVGVISGGCNPVPVTAETYTEQDGTITVPASFLKENAALFKNWKNF